MKRYLLVVAPAALLIGAAPSLAARPRATEAPRAALTGEVCVPALAPASRSFSVTAVMRPVTGTRRMEAMFTLLSKPAGGSSFTPVAGPGLGSWISPTSPATLGRQPGDVWYLQHPVAGLPAPAKYRVRVSFRWLGGGGRLLRSTALLSTVCVQPELRPDLVLKSVTVMASQRVAGDDVYVAAIHNLGATAAGPFTVQLNDAGQLVDATVQTVAAHGLATVRLTGPACSASAPPTVTIDPLDQLDVSSRSGATATVTCAAPARSRRA